MILADHARNGSDDAPVSLGAGASPCPDLRQPGLPPGSKAQPPTWQACRPR